MMMIDFEQAAVPKLQAVLEVILLNWKRKQIIERALNK